MYPLYVSLCDIIVPTILPYTVQEERFEEAKGEEPLLQDSSFLRSEHLSFEEFSDVVSRCENDNQLGFILKIRYDLPSTFIAQALRRAVASNKLDLLSHTLRINSLLPEDSTLRVNDDQILQLLQKAVSLDELEAFQSLLPHIREPTRPKTKMELQSLAILAAQLGSFLAVRLLCVNYNVCLQQTIQGRSILLEVARTAGASLESALLDLLDMGIYVNTQGPDGNTPLHIAAESGSTEAVKMLLAHGACSTIPNSQSKRAIDMAQQPEIVSLLKGVASSPLPHEVSLYHAAEQPDLRFVEEVLQKGIPIDSKWIHGRTALTAAVKAGNKKAVEFLLFNGAAPIPRGCYWPELPIVHALVNKYNDIALQLMLRTEDYYLKASSLEKKHIRSQLVFLLHYCAQIGATEVASLILGSRYRIDPNTEFRHRLAPIHVACKYGQLPMLKLLLLHRSRADLPSEIYLNSPLHYATFYGHTEVAQYLLTRPSVKINCKNIQHNTPLYCVLKCELTPYEKNSFVREVSVVFLLSNGASLIKPGRQNCELKEFTLDMAAQRWPFVPLQTQKLIIVLRDEGRQISLASEARLVIRGALQVPISEDVVSELGLPFRLQKYVLLKDWFASSS